MKMLAIVPRAFSWASRTSRSLWSSRTAFSTVGLSPQMMLAYDERSQEIYDGFWQWYLGSRDYERREELFEEA